MVPSNDHVERQPQGKATLYCPTCHHSNRINGDWILHVKTTHLDYECPECGEIIESRADGVDLDPSDDEPLKPGATP